MIEALIDFGEGEEIEEGVYDQGLLKLFSVEHILTEQYQHKNELASYVIQSKITYPTTVEERFFALVSV